MHIRFESTGADTIDVDQVYLGGNKGISEISQSTIAFEGKLGDTSCQWVNSTTGSFVDFPTDGDCPDWTASIQNTCDFKLTNSGPSSD